METKIKVFLASFTNQTNAQNLSCRALARYLDKDKFEVYTLEIRHGNLSSQKIEGVRVFKCRYPVKITGVLGFIWGFYHADVVYLPRGLFLNWQKRLPRIFKVKTFKTVRNVIDDDALVSALSQVKQTSNGHLVQAFNFADKLYSMTPYMAKYNFERWGLKTESETLLPPSDFESFSQSTRERRKLKSLIFIGNDWKRKGLNDFLDLAASFPMLHFHVVGRGKQSEYPQLSLPNVQLHGLLTEDQLLSIVKDSDLHILPSKSEGLPRVWLETLANGLPSVLYYGYGAEDFVISGQTGYVVDNAAQVKKIIIELLNQPKLLESMSKNCIKSSINYHPARLTKKYEKVIEDLYAS